ncbi:MAG TPA: hypothetical protein VGB76_20760 [Pyrinomonadaceae bacterium]|jgi:hypothetical protein
MADTKRQKIVSAFIARMQSILTENDYQTDIGARVEDWPRRFAEADLAEQPSKAVIGIYDLPDDITKENKSSIRVTHRLRMQARIFITSATAPEDLRKMIGDVVKAIGVDVTWGDLATDTEPASEGFIVPQDSMEVAGAAVECVIEYLTDTFDPYL